MDSLEREAKERKKKMIALASLPLCMGFFVWRVQTTTVAAPPPKAPPPPVVAQAAPAVAAAVGPILSLERQRVVEVPLGEKDPFIQTVNLDVVTGMTAPMQTPQMPVKPVMVTELPPITPLPLANPTLNTFGSPTPVTAPPALVTNPVVPVLTTPTAPPMPYVLSGIVQGNPDVAVLRHYDGSRRIARLGDELDSKFRLVAIQESTVVLEGAGEKKTLRLGGDVPATPPAKK
jgi:hypothetical protein